jgi:hypothetical protein
MGAAQEWLRGIVALDLVRGLVHDLVGILTEESETGPLLLIHPHVVHLKSCGKCSIPESLVAAIECKVKDDILGFPKGIIGR